MLKLFLIFLLSAFSIWQTIVRNGENKAQKKSSSVNREKVLKILKKSKSSLLSKGKFCGDTLPQNESNYPVKLYPTVIDYNKVTIKKIQSLQCSFIVNQDTQKIIFSLFMQKESAKNFIASSTNMKKATVGKPITVDNPPNAKIARLAKLNTSQMHYLIYLSSEEENPFKIVIPTYVPPNFRIASMEIISGGRESNRYSDATYFNYSDATYFNTYKIVYKGKSGECFTIDGLGVYSGGGGDWSGYEEIDIKSDIFGTVKFIYSQEDSSRSFFSPAFDVLFIGDPAGPTRVEGTYVFESRSNSKCKMPAVPELVKIFQSMKFLAPWHNIN